MKLLPRVYTSVLSENLSSNRQMAFVAGPRQVGKTTTCRGLADVYLDWDNEDHRTLILSGSSAVAKHAGLETLSEKHIIIVFDELHKYKRWKQFLKGFFDSYEAHTRVIVTGSSRLDVYRRGGDSLMGRYFLYHMHPLSVAELCRTMSPDSTIHPPIQIPDEDWRALCEHGGHPEPFVRRSSRFSLKWRQLRLQQLFREDIREMTGIQELDQLVVLARLLAGRSGNQLIYSSLAKQVRVSENTIRSWISTLCSFHYGFIVRPWFRNVSKALRKEPKWFLRDWSEIDDPSKRAETLCACHLLKAVEAWTDLGLGMFDLHYIRDTHKREVDFLVVRDGEPWFLVEVKHSKTDLSPDLNYFQEKTAAEHAFQVEFSTDYVDVDCFTRNTPTIVPARTLLSQLL